MSFMTNDAAIAGLNAILTTLGAGALLRVYDGTPPVDADVPISSQTLLAELAMDTPTAFGNAIDGGGFAIATAGAIADDVSADASGTPTFFRMVTSGFVTVLQGTAGASGTELNFSTVPFTAGGKVTVNDFYTQKLFET